MTTRPLEDPLEVCGAAFYAGAFSQLKVQIEVDFPSVDIVGTATPPTQ